MSCTCLAHEHLWKLMQNSTTLCFVKHKTLPYHTSLYFAQVKIFHFQRKEIERHPFSLSISTYIPTASYQTPLMVVFMQYRRPGGIPGISHKIFSQPESKQNLLKQVWQPVVHMPKTIQGQVSNDTQNRKPIVSTQLEAFKHGKGIVSYSLWDFLLENSRVCGGWWVHSESHWDVAGVFLLLSSLEVSVKVPRLRDGHSSLI